MQNELSALELKILRAIPGGVGKAMTLKPYAYAVWLDSEDRVQMGPVRCRYPMCAVRSEDAYSCSPFPGGWSMVDESRILRVRHLGALSLSSMTCVCQGTEWDTHCPAPDCTTPDRLR